MLMLVDVQFSKGQVTVVKKKEEEMMNSSNQEVSFSKMNKYNECVICLKDFEENEKLKMIPNCQHIFHERCLKKWF